MLLARRRLAAVVALIFVSSTQAQDACKKRGDLDPQYCDENGDRTAYEKETAREEAARKKAADDKAKKP